MKSTITILSLCLCFLWSCQSDPKAPAETSTEKEPTTSTNAPVHVISEKAAVMVGMWHCAIVVGRPDEMETYKGRWFNLKRDDTFVSGQWLEETNSGTWSYNDNLNMIELSFKEEEGLYANWKTQGDGEVIIWKGSTPLNTTGIQIKMEKHLDMARPGK